VELNLLAGSQNLRKQNGILIPEDENISSANNTESSGREVLVSVNFELSRLTSKF